MEEQRLLLASLQLYRSNFSILHWKAKGEDFDNIHKLMDEYGKKISDDIDIVAEMIIMQEGHPVGYEETIVLLSKINDPSINIKALLPEDDYLRDEAIFQTNNMVKNILTFIKAIIDKLERDGSGDTLGVKSQYEEMYYRYYKELNYLNKRRFT